LPQILVGKKLREQFICADEKDIKLTQQTLEAAKRPLAASRNFQGRKSTLHRRRFRNSTNVPLQRATSLPPIRTSGVGSDGLFPLQPGRATI
jgi:hypothetical protein